MSMNISSNFFNSMLGTSSSNSSSGLMGLLSDYNSIRNGSYLKLAKHYYSNDSAKKATQKQFSKSNIETKTEDTATKTASEDAWKDLKTLKDEKLYQSADTDKIQKNVKSFVSNYNSVMESAQNSDKSGVLKDASRLASQTGNYTSALAKIGITVKSDNTLAFDEEAFASADMSEISLSAVIHRVVCCSLQAMHLQIHRLYFTISTEQWQARQLEASTIAYSN